MVQLGTKSANPGRTEEEARSYNAGLRNIIQQLRNENTKDPEAVMAHITQYRRDYLGPFDILGLL